MSLMPRAALCSATRAGGGFRHRARAGHHLLGLAGAARFFALGLALALPWAALGKAG